MVQQESSDRPSATDPRAALIRFIETARAQGASDEFISKLLKNAGWSRRDIEGAFFQVYERLTDQPIPTPGRRGSESARDAFLYILSFFMLAVWTQALGQLAFIFINVSIPDPLQQSYGNATFGVAFSIARLLVSYPVYLLVMRQMLKELAVNPEKYQSGIRKWLTYFTLLVVSLIFIGTLIAFLTAFLRGELTLRFILKVITVCIIDGGVLAYYLVWLQQQPVKE